MAFVNNKANLIYIIAVGAMLLFTATLSLLISLILIQDQAFARCPNGYHKSPSGDCEKFIPHTGLPRCPNGYHRSPDGDCERVSNDNGDGTGTTTTTTEHKTNDNNNSKPLASGTATTTTTTNSCDQSLWNHVYNPARLQVIDSCKTVTGTIESIRTEADGDFHIRLKLDSQFSNLINSANIKGQHGDMVVEPICINPVTQADAISACQNYHQNIGVPPVGTHVEITGSYVLDREHGSWAEIHPVTSIKQQ